MFSLIDRVFDWPLTKRTEAFFMCTLWSSVVFGVFTSAGILYMLLAGRTPMIAFCLTVLLFCTAVVAVSASFIKWNKTYPAHRNGTCRMRR